MLPKQKRIRTRAEYRRLRKSRGVFRLGPCLLVREPNEKGHFRLGITVRAKSRSVDRTQIKRAIREAFRQMELEDLSLGSFDYEVVIPAGKSVAHPFVQRLKETLIEELMRLCANSQSQA